MNDKELVDAYFSDPKVVVMLNLELGFSGKIKVDWERRLIEASGNKSGRVWNLDEFLDTLKGRP